MAQDSDRLSSLLRPMDPVDGSSLTETPQRAPQVFFALGPGQRSPQNPSRNATDSLQLACRPWSRLDWFGGLSNKVSDPEVEKPT